MTVEQLRQLEQAATPGPWGDDGPWFHSEHDPTHLVTTYPERTAVAIMPPRHLASERDVASGADSRPADARLIAAARNALPALLDVAEAAQAVESGDVEALLRIGGPVTHRGDLYDAPSHFDLMGDYQEDARYIQPARDKLIDQALRAALARLEGATDVD